MNIRITLLFITSLLLVLAACSGRGGRHDERLVTIAGMVSDSPKEALTMLDSIDVTTLSDADRHFYDFLTVKAKDKSYITHDSDSVILNVIDYYSHHDPDGLYPEALYYGGRVYSDLGDSPTALRYFQQALDLLPNTTHQTALKSRILSQTGRLLEHIRLYNDAIPFLEKAISLNSIMQDTINLSYNLQLLGEVYLQLKQYDEASKCLNQALEATPSSHIAKVHLADIEYEKGNIPAALNLIENMADSVDHNERPYAVATAALIYSKAGLIDSVYHLAKQLIQQKGNGHIGYYLLTKEEMKDFVKPDSLYRYIQGYVAHTEKYMDNIVREKIILQETSYNYQKHERDKNRLLEENLKLKNKLIGCIAVISVLMIVFLLAVLYKTRSKLTLSRVLDNIRQIRIGRESSSPENALSLEKNNSESELKASLLKNLEDLAETNRFHLSESFLHSDTYDILQNLISTQKPIPENSELWSEIEKQINEWSPNFKKNLDILTDGKLKQTDYAIAVLIKCGFNTSQMGILLSRAKNTISTRKDSLSKKLFKEKRPSKDLETLIHSI